MEASKTDLITTCYGEVDENWRTVQFRTNKLEIMTEWLWVKPAQNKQMQYEKIRKQKTETNVFSISVRDSCCGFSRFKSTLLPFQVWLSIQVSAPCCANCDIRKKKRCVPCLFAPLLLRNGNIGIQKTNRNQETTNQWRCTTYEHGWVIMSCLGPRC